MRQSEISMTAVHQVSRLLSAALILMAASSAFAADDGAWTVSKSSGEVWLTGTSAQPASLKQEELLKPGDTVYSVTPIHHSSALLMSVGKSFRMVWTPSGVSGGSKRGARPKCNWKCE